MTREEAIKNLRECGRCGRWITVPQCDHCFVDSLPPRVEPAEAIAALSRAVALGLEAEKVRATLRGLLK